jgi:hypothetical protein
MIKTTLKTIAVFLMALGLSVYSQTPVIGAGVTSINNVGGLFIFSGPGVSCTSTTCTFTGGVSSDFPIILGVTSIAANSTNTAITGLTLDGVSPTTFGFVDPTSSIQAQLNAKTSSAIVPSTAPAAGQILVGNAGGTAYAPVTMSGSCTMASTGAITCSSGGSVTSVSNSDSTLTISPTTGAVVGSLNLNHANTWTAAQALGNSTATTQSQADNSTKLATTAYTDLAVANAVAGVNPAVAVLAASTANIAGTYTQVGGGIGDFFTVTATGAFTLDGIAINTIGQRVLLKDQSTASQNGVYTATVVGAVAVSPVFTRALDYDVPSDVNNTGTIPVQSGTVNTTTSWLLTSQVISIGSAGSSLTYTKFSLAPSSIVTASSPGAGVAHFAGSTQAVTSSPVVGSDMTNATVTATQLAAQYSKGSCSEAWGGSGASFALTSGDDAISNNTCYNDSGVTRTITAVKCRSDNGSNTTTVNPTFGSAGTGTTILSGALTCGNSYAYSSSGTVSNASWTTGTGIDPAMAGTLTGTSIAMIVEYTY